MTDKRTDMLEAKVLLTLNGFIEAAREEAATEGSRAAICYAIELATTLIGPPASRRRKAFMAYLKAADATYLDAKRYREAMLED